jgi:hypothetical protein
MTSDRPPLPGTPPAPVQQAYMAMTPGSAAAFRAHLLGGTSADWIADTMTRGGFPMGATRIRVWRRQLRKAGLI